MKVLLSGATGFIGRQVARQLAADKTIELFVVARRPVTDGPGVPIACDLLAPGEPRRLIEQMRPTHLVHLAWNATPGVFWRAPDNLDWVAASLNLLRAFAEHGGKRAVLAGTCAEYDWSTAVLSERDTPLIAETLYGQAKGALSRLVLSSSSELGISLAWGRVFWLYGPGEPSGRLVSDIRDALRRGTMAETSEGLQARDFLHVEDVAGAFVAALSSGYEGPFNIGSGEARTVREVASLFAEALGRPDLLRLGAKPSKSNDPPRLVADISILRDKVGFRPKFTLEAGLADAAVR